MTAPVTMTEVLARLNALTTTVAQLATVVTAQSPASPIVKDAPVKPTVKDDDVVTATYRHNGEVIGVITMTTKDFKSGNHGFYGNGKLMLKDKRYQTQSQMVGLK